ncbi:immunomodulatory [Paramyrothecium foliicola]|nr:immunomodulatory [Paramyrothecium foliicola]
MKVLAATLTLCISAALGAEVAQAAAEAAQVAEVAEAADVAQAGDAVQAPEGAPAADVASIGLGPWKPWCPPPPPCPIPDCPWIECPFPAPCPAIDCIQAPCFPPPFPIDCPIVDCAAPLPCPQTSILDLLQFTPKIDIDYTPSWGRGRPRNYIDSVVFTRVLADKPYHYRVYKGGQDLGVRDAYPIAEDGSQRLNFLEWNSGYGIRDTTTIQVYVVDPDTEYDYLVAQWN